MKEKYLRYFENQFGVSEQFLLIFSQNTVEKDWFKSEEEFLHTDSIYKFSILKYIDDDFKTDGVFEFIMQYPERGQFGHWRQELNPLEAEQDSDINVIDLGSTWETEVTFIGLHQSNNGNCFIEGVNTTTKNITDWYFAIGQKNGWSDTNRLPGFYLAPSTFAFHQVYLWLKITNLGLLDRIWKRHTCQSDISVAHMYIHCFVFLS